MNDKLRDSINNLQTSLGRYYQNLISAVHHSDRELLEYARHFSDAVSPLHHVHFGPWNCPLSIQDDSLIRYRPYELFELNPLQKHLEILRAESEAWLIHEKLGYRDFAQWGKNALVQRAVGILPENKEEQFIEILTCPGFRIGLELQNFYQSIERFKKGLQIIKKEFGQSTALPIGLLIQNGIRTIAEFNHYGEKLDYILHKIANLPQIQQLFR